MPTYENICEKLGFDFMTYKSETKDTEYDGDELNPFSVLSMEELDFVMKYARNNM